MPKAKQLDWSKVLSHVELTTSRGAYVAWFSKTELLEVENETATILVSNVFAKTQLEKKTWPRAFTSY